MAMKSNKKKTNQMKSIEGPRTRLQVDHTPIDVWLEGGKKAHLVVASDSSTRMIVDSKVIYTADNGPEFLFEDVARFFDGLPLGKRPPRSRARTKRAVERQFHRINLETWMKLHP